MEIKSYGFSDFEARVKEEFNTHSVIANWGKRKAYIVNDVIFTKNPVTQIFELEGKQISVADYFLS